jgi:DNA-directed RNA polymerase subunit delta
MTSKPGKGKTPGKVAPEKETAKKESSKPKKQVEEDEEDDELEENGEEVTPAKKGGKTAVAAKKSKGGEDDDDEEGGDDEVDDWNKVEEEEEWDPDFEEFDIPKSKGKKATGVAGKKGAEEEDDFKIDDEFKDMFNDESNFDEEEDDY